MLQYEVTVNGHLRHVGGNPHFCAHVRVGIREQGRQGHGCRIVSDAGAELLVALGDPHGLRQSDGIAGTDDARTGEARNQSKREQAERAVSWVRSNKRARLGANQLNLHLRR